MEKLIEMIMSEFDKLPHNEQVELFIEIRKNLLRQRESRTMTFKENLANAQENIEILQKGTEVILNPSITDSKAVAG